MLGRGPEVHGAGNVRGPVRVLGPGVLQERFRKAGGEKGRGRVDQSETNIECIAGFREARHETEGEEGTEPNQAKPAERTSKSCDARAVLCCWSRDRLRRQR